MLDAKRPTSINSYFSKMRFLKKVKGPYTRIMIAHPIQLLSELVEAI